MTTTSKADLNDKYAQLSDPPTLISHPVRSQFASVSAGQTPYTANSLNTQESWFANQADEDGWPVLDTAAYHGIAGEVIRAIDPYTEADQAGLLLAFLASFGNVVGSEGRAIAGEAPHPAKLNVLLVGNSARARKGTTQNAVNAIMTIAAPDWTRDRVMGGLSSGEGLLAPVDDTVEKETIEGVEIETARNPDKRLLVVESEFGRTLTVMAREQNTLSHIIREAWDGPNQRILNRTSPLTATGTHISIIGHITAEELLLKLHDVDVANGFANRFLFGVVRRSKSLPSGGNIPAQVKNHLGSQVAHAVQHATRAGVMERTPAAADLWADIYEGFGVGPAGILGVVTARADAQVLRLSVAYALLDQSPVIDVEHIKAAVAVWRYCEQSAAYIFGGEMEDPIVTRLLEELKKAGEKGLSETEQTKLFNGHVKKPQLDAARRALADRDLIALIKEPTKGPPIRRWYHTPPPNPEN